MKVAFGYSITAQSDFFVEGAKESSQISGQALAPGKWLVNYYPIRKFFPLLVSFPSLDHRK